jgi:hypothetical protein
MKSINRKKDQLPQKFPSYEEAGKFWDDHDSTDYLEYMTPVEVDVRLDRRHFEIDVDEEVIRALEERARESKEAESGMSEKIPKANTTNLKQCRIQKITMGRARKRCNRFRHTLIPEFVNCIIVICLMLEI